MSDAVYTRDVSQGRAIVGWSALTLGAMTALLLAIHLVAILLLATSLPDFVANVSRTTAIGGGIGYLLIGAMVLTSNDTAVRHLGRRRWRALHVTGLCVVFGDCVSSYGGRAVHNPNYLPHSALLLAILILRLLPSRARVD